MIARISTLIALVAPVASAQSQFIDIGTLVPPPLTFGESFAFDLSADGTTVVGVTEGLENNVVFNQAYRWRASQGIDLIGLSPGAFRNRATTVSPDGARIGGNAFLTGIQGVEAMVWSDASGSVAFAPLGQIGDFDRSIAAVGNGGSFVVGNSAGGQKWTPTGGTQSIQGTASFPFFLANEANRTGHAVVGTAFEPSVGFSEAAVWYEGIGTQGLGVPQGFAVSLGFGVSEDGTVVVGGLIDQTGAGRGGFRWTQATGMVGMGPGGSFDTPWAIDVSADGQTVFFGGTSNLARIWTPGGGLQSIRDLLTAGGAPLPPSFIEFRRMSDDGNAFIGEFLPPGTTERHAFVAYLEPPMGQALGNAVCAPAVINSSGASGELTAVGSLVASDNEFRLDGQGLPAQVFALLVNGPAEGFLPNPGGSQGNLCIAGGLGRFNQNLVQSDATGAFSSAIELSTMPRPNGSTAVSSGQTWCFQAWYRDVNPVVTSNFTSATCVTFE